MRMEVLSTMELLQLEFVWVLLDGHDPSAGEIVLEVVWSLGGSPRLNIQVSGRFPDFVLVTQ